MFGVDQPEISDEERERTKYEEDNMIRLPGLCESLFENFFFYTCHYLQLRAKIGQSELQNRKFLKAGAILWPMNSLIMYMLLS